MRFTYINLECGWLPDQSDIDRLRIADGKKSLPLTISTSGFLYNIFKADIAAKIIVLGRPANQMF